MLRNGYSEPCSNINGVCTYYEKFLHTNLYIHVLR